MSGQGLADAGLPRLEAILDITYLDWQGKPHPLAYAKVEALLRRRHGEDIRIHFADDRPDNLLAARARDWVTIWVNPEDGEFPETPPEAFHTVVPSLIHLDPESLA